MRDRPAGVSLSRPVFCVVPSLLGRMKKLSSIEVFVYSIRYVSSVVINFGRNNVSHNNVMEDNSTEQ